MAYPHEYRQKTFYGDPDALLNEVKAIVKSLLASTKAEVTIHCLNRDYYAQEGDWIPYKIFGEDNIEDFLCNSLNDVVHVNPSLGTVSLKNPKQNDKSVHVRKLVSKQKETHAHPQSFEPKNRGIPTTRRFPRSREENFLFVRTDLQKDAIKILNQSKNVSNASFAIQFNKCIKEQTKSKTENIETLYGTFDRLMQYGLCHLMASFDGRVHLRAGSFPMEIQCLSFEDVDECVPMVKEATRQKLMDLLIEEPTGVLCSDLLELYLNTYGTELEYTAMGYPTVLEFMSAMKEFRIVLCPDEGEMRIYDKRNPYPPEKGLAKKDIDNILMLLRLFENVGVELDLFLHMYKLMFQRDLFVQPAMFETLTEALESLEDKGVRIGTIDGVRVVVLLESSYALIPKAIPFKWKMGAKEIYPEDVWPPYKMLPAPNVSNRWRDHELVDIEPTDVYGPHCFFAVQNKYLLNDLMAAIQTLYKSAIGKYSMSSSQCTVGTFCVVEYLEVYHRGFILLAEYETAIVLFIDFGRVEIINKKNFYFLHKSFDNPPHAIYCSMNAVQPINEKGFTKSDNGFFFDLLLSNETFMYAKIRKIDLRNMHVHVSLMSLRDEDNPILVDEELIKNGHARPMFKNPMNEPMIESYWILFLKKLQLADLGEGGLTDQEKASMTTHVYPGRKC